MPSSSPAPTGRTPVDPGADAAETLADLETISRRSRQAASAALTRIPLASWGAAWVVGFALLDQAPWRLAVPVGLALAAGAAVATWTWRSPQIRSGRETRIGLGWLALMLCSPFLVAVVSPIPDRVEMMFLGALWGVALLLYGIASADVAPAVVGAITVLAATISRVSGIPHPLLVFGAVAGGSMLALGLRRTWRYR